MVIAVDGTVFVSVGTAFAVDRTVFVAGEMVLAMDGAVSLQNRQPAACQPAALVTFSLHLGKAPAPSRRCPVY